MTSNDTSPLTDTEVHYLHSDHVGDDFKIHIGHTGPPGTVAPHVLFFGDAWGQFGTALEMVRLLHICRNLPPILVVGIGYRVARIEDNDDLRTRDFSPSVDPACGWANQAVMGGAGRFLSFIRDELKPWVGQRYGVDPDDSAFFGDSFGGLFATYVLFNEPTTFQRYGIGSPNLEWDGELLFGQEEAYAQTHDDLPARVYFGVGGYEDPAGFEHWVSQVPPDLQATVRAEVENDPMMDTIGLVRRMASTLAGRGYPSLRVDFEVHPGEYHETAPTLNLSRSIRYLFDAPR